MYYTTMSSYPPHPHSSTAEPPFCLQVQFGPVCPLSTQQGGRRERIKDQATDHRPQTDHIEVPRCRLHCCMVLVDRDPLRFPSSLSSGFRPVSFAQQLVGISGFLVPPLPSGGRVASIASYHGGQQHSSSSCRRPWASTAGRWLTESKVYSK